MKKAIALILAVCFCAVLAVVPASAANKEFSVLPDSKSEIDLNNCEMKVNPDGSVTFTITGSDATANLKYDFDGTVYEEKKVNMKEDGKWFLTSYKTTGTASVGFIVKHDRKDKQNADLYLASMEGTDYSQYQDKDSKADGVTAWDWRTYLESSGGKRMPEDGIITIKNVAFNFYGSVGDTVTIYRMNVANEIPADFGKESEAPAPSESSEAPAESSQAPAESSDTPSTADAGVFATVIMAVVALGSAVLVIRKRA